jgi:peptide/nickel transport system substrate-binding protein
MATVTDEMTVQLKIPEQLVPTLVLNCLSAGVGSVVDKKVALAHETDGDFGHEWLKINSAASGPFALKSWQPNERIVLEAAANSRYGPPGVKRVILRHVPEEAGGGTGHRCRSSESEHQHGPATSLCERY